ncbi:porin [Lonepinella sp. MS14437]|uniref:porin n=1 Tax=Lonepinella sp. MS14437 TaxID=3003620 RepID=UPI0036DD7888
MKKTLIALAVAALASSAANATVVYQQDGTKLDVDGRISMQVRNETGKRTDLVDKGSRVRVRAYQEIGNGFSALANMEIRFTQHGTIGDGIHTKRLFGGFEHKDVGTLTFGRQLTTGDAIGLSDYTYELGAIVKVVDSHNKAVHFESAKFGGFHFGADYLFGDATKESTSGHTADADQGFALGAFYSTKVGEFGFSTEGGYSEQTKGTLATNDYKVKSAGAAIGLSYGPVEFGFDWAHQQAPKGKTVVALKGPALKDSAGSSINYEKIDQFEVGLKYHVTPNNAVYAEYLFGTGKTQGMANDKLRGWFLGADHHFNKNVLVYVEGGSLKIKGGDTGAQAKNKQIALGTRIFF